MQILHTPDHPATLPTMWPLQPGEEPCSAAGAAGDLHQLLSDTSHDSQAILSQLGAAPDVTAQARVLGLQLQQQLALALQTAEELRAATRNSPAAYQ
jgi:hypothetical protein